MRRSYQQARHWLKRALRKDPRFWIASYDLGVLSAEEEDWSNAAKSVAKLLDMEISKQDPLLCYQIATYMIRANRKVEASRAADYYLKCLTSAAAPSAVPTAEATLVVDTRRSLAVGVDEAVRKTFAELVLDKCEKSWADSGFFYYLSGKRALAGDDTEHALELFAKAFSCDARFWLAAVNAAQLCAFDENWHGAASWYRLVLKIHEASRYPSIWFWAAFCFGKTRNNAEEVEAYRECLKRCPSFTYAKNNLGYALYKAGELQEAERVLREAIKFPIERQTAIQNLARVLKMLNRLQDAIDVLREDRTSRGRIRRPSLRTIEKLERFLAARNGDSATLDEGEDEAQDFEPTKSDRFGEDVGENRAPVPKEKVLEELIEQKIRRGDFVFNRRLKMYGGFERLYGRQFPIPGIGVIDLLAEDVDTDDLVVVELKRGEATKETIQQIDKYVKWISNNLSKPNQKVVAVICAYKAHEKLRLAAYKVGIEVFEYDVTFVRVDGTKHEATK